MTSFFPIVGSDYPSKVIPLINSAKKTVDIVMYDWRWYPNQPAHPVQRFNIAIVDAIKRGVTVRAIVNRAEILPMLIKVGVKARVTRDHRTLHAKLLFVDDSLLVIGSHNITRNAFTSNIEVSVAVSIPPESTRLQEFFSNLFVI